MEKLTSDLASAALEIIEEVESLGGMTKAIDSGMAKMRIEEAATKKQVRSGIQGTDGGREWKSDGRWLRKISHF